MAYETEGLPGLYRRKRGQEAVAAAPNGVKRNREKINELEKRIIQLEKKIKRPRLNQ